MIVRTIGMLALAMLLAGCVNQAREVATYRAILDDALPGRVPPLAPGEPLGLRRALLLANQDNETLAIRGEDYIQALAEKDRAVAGFLPTITLAPNYTVADFPGTGGGGAVGTIGGFKIRGNTQRRFEAPVNAGGNLFRGFRDKAAFESAVATAEQRKQILFDAQATLLIDVAETYYLVLRLEQSVKVVEKSLQSLREGLRKAETTIQAGSGKTLDVAQARAQVATTQVQLVQARGDVTNARTLLAYLIGATGRVTGPLTDEFNVPARVDELPDILEDAFETREDLRAARAAVEAAKADVNFAVGQYYPSISLNFTGFLFRENFENSSQWNSVLNINLPIFSAGLIEADVRAAWSRLRQAAMAESLLRRRIEQEVRTRFENLQTSRARLAELRVQIDAATEALRQASAGRDAGTAIMLDVLTAEDVLRRAELDLATEQFNEKVQYLDLLRNTGRLGARMALRAATGPASGPATRPAIGPGTAPAQPS